MKSRDQEVADATATLRSLVQPGQTVYTVLRHVSKSGMSREISPLVMTSDGPLDLTQYTATALGLKHGKRDGVVMGGCGMDLGFHLVYLLSRRLYGGGYACMGRGCPSNYHTNYRRRVPCACLDVEREDDAPPCPLCGGSTWVDNPEAERFDLIHADGYALQHRWL